MDMFVRHDVGPKSYHLGILDAINEAPERGLHSYGYLQGIASVIKATKVPREYHPAIKDRMEEEDGPMPVWGF